MGYLYSSGGKEVTLKDPAIQRRIWAGIKEKYKKAPITTGATQRLLDVIENLLTSNGIKSKLSFEIGEKGDVMVTGTLITEKRTKDIHLPEKLLTLVGRHNITLSGKNLSLTIGKTAQGRLLREAVPSQGVLK